MLTFDPETASYFIDDNRLADDDVKRVMLLFLLLLGEELQGLAEEAAKGEITLEAFQRGAMRLIKSGYIAAGLLGAGEGLTRRQRGLIESDLRDSFTFLERFVRNIEERTMLRARSVQMIVNRIKQYATAANSIFERTRRDAHLAAADEDGHATYQEERNVLGAAEHCVECLEETAKGWVRIGTLITPGKRLCRSNCRCRLVYR